MGREGGRQRRDGVLAWAGDDPRVVENDTRAGRASQALPPIQRHRRSHMAADQTFSTTDIDGATSPATEPAWPELAAPPATDWSQSATPAATDSAWPKLAAPPATDSSRSATPAASVMGWPAAGSSVSESGWPAPGSAEAETGWPAPPSSAADPGWPAPATPVAEVVPATPVASLRLM